MIKNKIFPNRSALQTFFILLIGFLFIQGSALFIFNTYFTLTYSRTSTSEIANEVLHATTLAQLLDIQDFPVALRSFWFRGVRMTLSNKSLDHAVLLYDTNPKAVRSLVYDHPNHLAVSMPLADGRWLNIVIDRKDHPWLFLGFSSAIIVLIAAIFLLCLWIVQRFAEPLRGLSRAAIRFSVDPNAPAMAVTGPQEIQELAMTFNEMQGRIRRLINDRTEMLAAISHDLRTPITRLKLRAEFISNTGQYEKTVSDLDVMEKMIGSILAFARNYSAEEPMEKFDLFALIETIVADMIDLGHDVSIEGEFNRVVFLGRVIAIRRALVNLIENGIKYGHHVIVSLQILQQNIVIRIMDEGEGIPDNELEKVFTPFYRVDPARSPDIMGTGLGLAVTRDIIRSHGGEVELKNKKPKGLVAIVTLPMSEL